MLSLHYDVSLNTIQFNLLYDVNSVLSCCKYFQYHNSSWSWATSLTSALRFLLWYWQRQAEAFPLLILIRIIYKTFAVTMLETYRSICFFTTLVPCSTRQSNCSAYENKTCIPPQLIRLYKIVTTLNNNNNNKRWTACKFEVRDSLADSLLLMF